MASTSSYCVQLKIKSSEAEKLSYAIWELPGVLGVEEAPLNGDSLFRPEEEFEILEFGSEAAKKCAEWMEREAYRPQGMMLIKIYIDEEKIRSFGGVENWLKGLPSRFKFELLKEEKLEDKDYLKAYKEETQGMHLEHGLFIGPPWSKDLKEGPDSFVVEPGLAFGTGDHPTTQLCLERIKEYSFEEKWKAPIRVLDLGAGSGILGLALKRYFPQIELVLADYDPLCGAEIEKTFHLNQISLEGIKVLTGEPGSIASLSKQNLGFFDLVVSNIYAEVLAAHVLEVQKLLAPGAIWLMSGILKGTPENVLRTSLEKHGLQIVLRRERDRLGTRWTDQGLVEASETWVALELN